MRHRPAQLDCGQSPRLGATPWHQAGTGHQRTGERGCASGADGDFELTCSDGQVVNATQLLKNPHCWHNARCADPLDPDADKRVASARLLNDTRPELFSHRHGNMRYELRRQSARVQSGRGMRVDYTDAVLQVLRDRSELFDFGTNAIAFVADGKATPVSRDWLVDHAGRVAEFYSVKTESDEDGSVTSAREIPEDAPTYIANAIIAKQGSRNFRKWKAVTRAPTLRPDSACRGFLGPLGTCSITQHVVPRSSQPSAS